MFIVVKPVFSATFDYSFLPNPIKHEDAMINNDIFPGVYGVGINVNSISSGEVSIHFIENAGKTAPCINKEVLHLLGVNSESRELSFNEQGCVVPEHRKIEYQYDNNNMSIDFFVKKNLMMTDYQKNIQQLEHGINAIRVSYDASTYVIAEANSSSRKRSSFVTLSTNANVDAWRFVSNAYINQDHTNKTSFNSSDMYVYRPMIDSKSVMYFGKKSTQLYLFESRHFTGVEYMTEPRLHSQYGNSAVPAISVILLENSVVRLYQNKQMIYESYFLGGNHEINDYMVISQSDIDIEIEGDDGKVTNMSVPNRVFRGVLDSGSSFYYISGGVDSYDNNNFIIGSYQYGVTDWLSVTYGADVSSKGVSLGIAADTSLGIYGESRVQIVSDVDKSYVDVNYSKSLSDFSTSIGMSHRSFMYKKNYNDIISQTNTISLNTNIPNYTASANIGLIENRYTKTGSTMQVSTGFGGSINDVNYNFNYMRALKSDVTKDAESLFGLSVNAPLNLIGLNSGGISRVFNSKGGTTSLSASGIHDKGDWTTYVSKQDSVSNSSLGGAAKYHTGIAEINAFASTSSYANNMRLGAKGGVLFSEHGMKLSENMSETIMLVHTPEVEGITYTNDKYESSNTDGLAIVDNIAPYVVTRATIDVNNLPDDVDLPTLSTTGVASQGAVLYKKLSINTGSPLLIELANDSDAKVPFGANVYVPGYDNPIVAEGDGTIFIPALPLNAKKVDVVWKTGKCKINLNKDNFVNGGVFSNYVARCD